MATLYITEFSNQGRDAAGYLNQNGNPVYPAITTQTVAIGASSTQSAALNAGTTLVRVHADAICSIKVAASPTAAATDMRLAANSTEWLCVPAGSGYKIAVITNT